MKNTIILWINLFLGISLASSQNNGIISDIDGNVYRTVTIGNQVWMAENLRTTKLNNGTDIVLITEQNLWEKLTSAAYCWYKNDSTKAGKYGSLYNWYAVNTNKLCPEGWRVPSDKEWMQLEAFADSKYEPGDTIWFQVHSRGFDAGRKLKSDTGWAPDCTGTNNFGFNALPGGERVGKISFLGLNQNGFWWSSTPKDSSMAWYRCMINCVDGVFRGPHPKFVGFSVRCLEDLK